MSFFSFPTLVNERAARLVAAFVGTSLTASLAFEQRWIVPVLAVGFLLIKGLGSSLDYFKTVDQAIAQRSSIGSSPLRV